MRVTWLQSVWQNQLSQLIPTDSLSLSNTTKLLIAWFTSTRGVYHNHKQGAFGQTVCFFRTKESPLNSRCFPCHLSFRGSGYLDGWWNSKTKCVEPGQSEGKWPFLKNNDAQPGRGKLLVKKRHTKMALLSPVRQCVFKWMLLKTQSTIYIASKVFAF